MSARKLKHQIGAAPSVLGQHMDGQPSKSKAWVFFRMLECVCMSVILLHFLRLFALTGLCLINANTVMATPPVDSAENQLYIAIQHAEAGNWQKAIQINDELCRSFPEFRAAVNLQSLLKQRLLPKSVFPLTIPEDGNEYLPEKIAAELNLRLLARQTVPDPTLVPDAILSLGNHQYALFIDLSLARLYLLNNLNDVTNILAHYYVGIGRQGPHKEYRDDLRTPVGVYNITNKLPDAKLPELYGAGAWTLDYPNTWDKRKKRTGSGIWIHGVPRSTYSRTPYSSQGCVTLSNHIFSGLQQYIRNGKTPVIISERPQWIKRELQQQRRRAVEQMFLDWKKDWESLDFERYIKHYSRNFDNGIDDFINWRKRKQLIYQRSTQLDVDVENINIYNYPSETSLMQIDFKQHYKSNRYSDSSNKRQYWEQEEDGNWRIIYEGVL